MDLLNMRGMKLEKYGPFKYLYIGGVMHRICVVEINTAVPVRLFGFSLNYALYDIRYFWYDRYSIGKVIPREHVAPVLNQMTVTGIHLEIYI